ncbi:hypothetical protein VNO77_19899 [Canavalia gladiata]|uniref:Uncharacterized protein n=1 Tax=Canavalia gladiata TaxID=3824 RepID=A0AAN9QQ16_CANGL
MPTRRGRFQACQFYGRRDRGVSKDPSIAHLAERYREGVIISRTSDHDWETPLSSEPFAIAVHDSYLGVEAREKSPRRLTKPRWPRSSK